LTICFDLLSEFFKKDSELDRVNLVYELFTTGNLVRKMEILLTEDLGELAKCKAWTDLISSGDDVSLLVYTALQAETLKPGTVPSEMLEGLMRKISPNQHHIFESLPELTDDSVEYIDEVEALLKRDSDLGKFVAHRRVRELLSRDSVTREGVEKTRRLIENDLLTLERLIGAGHGNCDSGEGERRFGRNLS